MSDGREMSSRAGRTFLLLAASSFLAAAILLGGELLNVFWSPFESQLSEALRVQYPLLPRLVLLFPAGVLWEAFFSYWCLFAASGLLILTSWPVWSRWSGTEEKTRALPAAFWAIFGTLLIFVFGVLVLRARVFSQLRFFSPEYLSISAAYGVVCLLAGRAAFKQFLRLPEARRRSGPALSFCMVVFLIFPVLSALNRMVQSQVRLLDVLMILLGALGALLLVGRIPTPPLSAVATRWRRLGRSVRTTSAGGVTLVVGAAIALSMPSWTWPELPEGIRLEERDGMLNVALVVIDTARADRFSCYGHVLETTPYIDRIAREGVLFENVVSPSNWTLPAHASMFTGLYPSEHQATGEHRYLQTEFLTLAEILRGVGYRTAAFSNSPFVGFAFGMAQGFETFHPPHPRVDQKRPPLLYEIFQRRILGDVTRKKVDLVSGSAKSVSYSQATNGEIRRWIGKYGSDPFFLFVNYFDPHHPYHPPKGQREKFFSTPREEALALELDQDPNRFITGIQKLREEDLRRLGGLYDGEIAIADAAVGSLYEILGEAGVLEETVFIVTSDHGEYLGEHGLMEHSLGFHEPALRVPLIIRSPSVIVPGTRVATLVQNMDIFYTVLNLLGVEGVSPPRKNDILNPQDDLPAMADGFRFDFMLNILRTTNPSFDTAPFDRQTQVIYKDGLKYIEDTNGGTWLYDVARDPAERQNLATINPGLTYELKELLAHSQRTPTLDVDEEEIPIDEDTLRSLRALGYME